MATLHTGFGEDEMNSLVTFKQLSGVSGSQQGSPATGGEEGHLVSVGKGLKQIGSSHTIHVYM